MNALLLEPLILKHLDREGWKRVGIVAPESVAAHSWGMCWLVMVLAPEGIDKFKALQLAVIHDLAEVRTGDITPHDGVTKAEKKQRETDAISEILQDRSDLLGLWHEYEKNETPEARFVHDLDRLDMALQARVYADDFGVNTREFLDSAQKIIHDQGVEALIRQLAET